MANTDYSRGRWPNKSLSPKAWMLIAVVVFAALHLLAGFLLFHASSPRAAETSPTEIHRD